MRHVLALVLAILILGVAHPALAAERIGQAEVTMTIVPDKAGRFADVQVIERLHYVPDGEPGGSASQLLAPWQIDKLAVFGPDGFPLRHDYDPVEGRLRWSWPADADRSVDIRYVAKSVIQETWSRNELRADWLGRFPVPVDHLQLQILFPQGFVPQGITSSWEKATGTRPVQTVALGVQAIQIEALQPPNQPFVLGFGPKLVTVTPVWLLTVGGVTLLIVLTLLRMRRLPAQPLLDLRDPTPTEVAYLDKGARGAIIAAHFDLLLRRCLRREGDRLVATGNDAAIEPYEQILLSFYQTPQTMLDFMIELNAHPAAFEAALKTSLGRKGLLRDLPVLKACGYELLGYLSIAGMLVGTLTVVSSPWSQHWIQPWLLGAAAFAVAFTAFACYFLKSGHVSRLGQVKLTKFERLARQGMRVINPEEAYRPQLAYAAAIMGFEWLQGSVPEEDLALFLPLDPTPSADNPEPTPAP